MTSQSSITDKKSSGALAFFRFSLKQSWTVILLFSIILFFVLPVLSLMLISGWDITTPSELADIRKDFVESWLPVIRYPLVILGCVFATVISCRQFTFTKNKVSTDFYHSLPLKRGQLYVNGLAVSLCVAVIPFVINILLTLAVFGVNSVLTGALFTGILKMLVDVFVYSAFCYALTTLVGMVCGLTPVTLTLSLIALFIVPATAAVTLGFIDIFCENMWLGFYLDTDKLENMSPAMRFLLNGDRLDGISVSVLLLISAVMLIGAYFVYRIRKSERSGTPIVFGPLGEVIKYILMFLATLLLGLLFYYIMAESFFWTVFGMICGAVLTFMLTNTVLNKTAKAMFKGAKGLAIYGGAMALCMVLLMSGIFGINGGVPGVDFTARAVVNLDNSVIGLELRSKESIEAIRRIYTDCEESHIFYREDYSNWNDDIHIEVVFYPEIGIPVAKAVTVYNKSDFVEDFKTILNDESFAPQYVGMIEERINSDGMMYERLVLPSYVSGQKNERLWNDYRYFYSRRNVGYGIGDFNQGTMPTDEIIAEAANAGFDYFQERTYGFLEYDTVYDSRYFAVPLRSGSEAVRNKLIESGFIFDTDKEEIDSLTEKITEIKVYDFNTDSYSINGKTPYISITDKNEIRQILEASVNIYGEYRGDTVLQFNDRSFMATYTLPVTDANNLADDINYTEDEIKELDSNDEYNSYYRTSEHVFTLYFRYGQTPAFLSQ